MADAITLRGIAKAFRGRPVLDGLDLTVAAGDVVALLGPNGAGKTTTIGILTTLVRPDAGIAVVAGHDVVRDPEGVKRSISLTGQSAAVDDLLTGVENLRLLGRLGGLSAAGARRRADELLARFGLVEAAGRRVRTYSGGMRRRLDLALGLIGTPPVVLLDEPTTGLDTRSRQELWSIVRSLADDGTTVLLTTQYLEEADRLADRVAVLDRGRIVVEGAAQELKARVGREVLAVHDRDGVLLREIPTDGTVADVRAALAAVEADGTSRVRLRTPSLDDVFLAVTAAS